VTGLISHSIRSLLALYRHMGRTCALGFLGAVSRRASTITAPLSSSSAGTAVFASAGPLMVLFLRDDGLAEEDHRPPGPLLQASIIAGSERSRPTTATRARCSSAHAGHSSNVYCAVASGAPQWRHSAVRSRPIQHRNSPRHPCPVRICAARKGILPPPRPIHSARRGWIAAATRAVLGLAR